MPRSFTIERENLPEVVQGWLKAVSLGDEELARRRAAWKAPPAPERGWAKLYVDHVQQAHLGADLDILVGGSGSEVAGDSL